MNTSPPPNAPSLYRPCVGIMLVNRDGLVFAGQRSDNPQSEAWQMPQGGIDEGESPEQAALRELHEETGITSDKISFLGQLEEPVCYDLPDELQGKLWGGRYRGQQQEWFLLRFLGEDADININAHPPAEFREWQWVEPNTLIDNIVPFKKRVYRIVTEQFAPLI